MKAVCDALGIARSHVHERLGRDEHWVDGRTARVRDEASDSKLIEAVSGGWPKILSNLKSLLETGAVAVQAKKNV